MNPWKILEIKCTADVKSIKRAYAKKLKITKPDEKPKEFQILHQAYKNALDYAIQKKESQNEQQSDDFFEPILSINLSEDLKESPVFGEEPTAVLISDNGNSDAKVDAIFNSEHQEADGSRTNQLEIAQRCREEEYHRLIAEVENILNANLISSDEHQWGFLANTPYLLEDEFNWGLGKKVFQLFGEYSKKRVRRARGRYYNREIPLTVVNFCDTLFSWSNRAYFLEQEFGYELCRELFFKLEEDPQKCDPSQGIRGGILIRNYQSSLSPTGPKPSFSERFGFSEINPIGLIFFLVMILNLFRHCSH